MTGSSSAAVPCLSCGHGYDGHAARGGPCTSAGPSSSAPSWRCPCPAFRWVDPEGPATGSYTAPPVSPA